MAPLSDGVRDPLDRLIVRADIVRLVEHPTEALVLVTGEPRAVVRAVLHVAHLADVAAWSDSGNGWTVPAQDAPAAEAAAVASGVPVQWRRRAKASES